MSFWFRMSHNESVNKYLHYAQQDENDDSVYHVCWDHDYIKDVGVTWFSANNVEIADFIEQERGWVIEK